MPFEEAAVATTEPVLMLLQSTIWGRSVIKYFKTLS